MDSGIFARSRSSLCSAPIRLGMTPVSIGARAGQPGLAEQIGPPDADDTSWSRLTRLLSLDRKLRSAHLPKTVRQRDR